MNDKKEKLSLLSEMIAFVRSDHDVNQREYDFIDAIARHMDIRKEELDILFNDENTPYVPPKPESERILQFHRLVLLMNIDEVQHPKEIQTLKEFGLRMGLSPFAIERVLQIMNSFPNGVVPPEILVDIFKTYYN